MDDKNIDCSKIAEKFGGSGHKRTAGFVSDELLFKKIYVAINDKKY